MTGPAIAEVFAGLRGAGLRAAAYVSATGSAGTIAAIDDEDCLRLARLFNEPAGRDHLASLGVTTRQIRRLRLLGISSVCNLLAAIKTAKHFELDGNDVIFTVFTDSMQLYQSRLAELRTQCGAYTRRAAIADFAGPLAHQGFDNFKELSHPDRKAIHNLKYYTWVDQQGKTPAELNAQWQPEYWRALFDDEVAHFDRLIISFNGPAT
ncbi:MAG: hypothetical protein EXS43_13695 [Opitutus sp.]|nr:hypothetical protein [Opitutus sp.]